MAAQTRKSSQQQIVIAGFAEVGKTTFLAALWHVLTSKGEVPGALTLANLPKEAEHLNALRDKWQSCEKVDRTTVSSEQTLTLDLARCDGVPLGTVVLPDLAGESFSAQWSQRQAPAAMAEQLRQSVGVLLLVHATEFHLPERLRDTSTLAATLAKGSAQTATPQTAEPWTPEHAGTDVQLVDLLQCMRFHVGERTTPIRLALVASAWDLVENTSLEDWLRQRLPLLKQYLEANPDLFDVRLYGISAQGGDYTKGTDDLLIKLKPAERIQVVGPECEPHDVTAPLAWLLTG